MSIYYDKDCNSLRYIGCLDKQGGRPLRRIDIKAFDASEMSLIFDRKDSDPCLIKDYRLSEDFFLTYPGFSSENPDWTTEMPFLMASSCVAFDQDVLASWRLAEADFDISIEYQVGYFHPFLGELTQSAICIRGSGGGVLVCVVPEEVDGKFIDFCFDRGWTVSVTSPALFEHYSRAVFGAYLEGFGLS